VICILPEDSHANISQFLDGVESMRSYFISNIRKQARDIFLVTVGHGVFAKGRKRSDIPEIVVLLRNAKRPEDIYPRYPSVLYKDSVIAGKNLFGSSAIINVSVYVFSLLLLNILLDIEDHIPWPDVTYS
jgi:hypothetical protein